MKTIGLVLTVMAVLMLSGCATPYDVDLAKEYFKDHSNHSQENTKKAYAKANAIKEVLRVDCKDDTAACGYAKALSGALAARDISAIQGDRYEGKSPTYSTDVQIKALETATDLANPVVTGVVAVKAIDKDKGVVNNTASDSSTVNNSYDEDHATALNSGEGDVASTNTPSGNHEEVITPPVE